MAGDWPVQLPVNAIGIVFVSSTGIGFDVYPARAAAALDPIEALRHGQRHHPNPITVSSEKERGMTAWSPQQQEDDQQMAVLHVLGMTVAEIGRRNLLPTAEKPEKEGVIVVEARFDCEARKAGVAPGDIIHEVNGVRIRSLGDLSWVLSAHEPPAPIRLLFRREGIWRFFTVSSPLPSRPFSPLCSER